MNDGASLGLGYDCAARVLSGCPWLAAERMGGNSPRWFQKYLPREVSLPDTDGFI